MKILGISWEVVKKSILFILYEKPKPLWISVSLYHRDNWVEGDNLIDQFKVCIDKARPVVSDSRAHGYKIVTKVI